MQTTMISTVFVLCLGIFQSQELTYDRKVDWNLPDAVLTVFRAQGILRTYNISDAVNPFYLRGDFDGDGKPDYAVLVERRGSMHRQIAVVLSSLPKVAILGAGASGCVSKLARIPTTSMTSIGWTLGRLRQSSF